MYDGVHYGNSYYTGVTFPQNILDQYGVQVTKEKPKTISSGVMTAMSVPTSGLVGEWLLNGNANDTSGQGNNGTAYNTSTSTDRFNKADSALEFNGSNSTIVIPQTSSISFTNSHSFTVSIWFKPTDSRNAFFMLKNAVYGFMWRGTSQSLAFYNGSYHYSNKSSWNLGQWYHVVMVDDGSSTVKLYIDGALDQSENPNPQRSD